MDNLRYIFILSFFIKHVTFKKKHAKFMNPFQRMLMQFVAFQTVQIETVPLINELCRLKSRLQFAENSFDIVQKLPRQFNKLHQLNY